MLARYGFALLAALAGGFVAGLVLSDVIGIAGVLLFQHAVGIKYLPVYLALLAAGGVLAVELARRNRAR